MRYGCVLSHGSPAEILELARAADASGWDGVFTWDAISLGDSPIYDPWVMMSAIAVVTERVTIGAMVLPLARRRPWKVAKEAITIDHLSNGRLVLPVALGVPEDRGFSGVNTDTPDRKTRAELLDECLDILALAQQTGPINYTGTHYQVADMTIRPLPIQDRIPVWVVGAWPRPKSLARAARWDGLILSDMSGEKTMWSPPTPEVIRSANDWIRDHRQSSAPFDIIVEGKTDGPDDTGYLQTAAEAGATWFIESRWDNATTESLMERIVAGPPRMA